jgi:hypothetical protein
VHAGSTTDRRARDAQRKAVDRVLPDPDSGALLRTAGGEVLVYDEQNDKLNPVDLRAVVMPDGSVREFETGRFRRNG